VLFCIGHDVLLSEPTDTNAGRPICDESDGSKQVISVVISVQNNVSDKSIRKIIKISRNIILILKILGKLFFKLSMS